MIKRFYLKYRRKKLENEIGNAGYNFQWKGKYVENPERLFIGNNVYIGPGARLYSKGKIQIEDGVICGPNLTIYTYNHNYFDSKYLPYDEVYKLKPVHIGKNVWIGDSVSVIPGINIGEGSIIGMRSVVVKDIPPFSIVGGNPAKVIRMREDIDNYKQLDAKGLNYLHFKDLRGLKPKHVDE
ncbi:acyltransferase [Flagellimonas sp.]|uniref:acyltransferase n=1 Tax=Flagellimonas sp. TaxID=2058762 RepID=UPI003B50346A